MTGRRGRPGAHRLERAGADAYRPAPAPVPAPVPGPPGARMPLVSGAMPIGVLLGLLGEPLRLRAAAPQRGDLGSGDERRDPGVEHGD